MAQNAGKPSKIRSNSAIFLRGGIPSHLLVWHRLFGAAALPSFGPDFL